MGDCIYYRVYLDTRNAEDIKITTNIVKSFKKDLGQRFHPDFAFKINMGKSKTIGPRSMKDRQHVERYLKTLELLEDKKEWKNYLQGRLFAPRFDSKLPEYGTNIFRTSLLDVGNSEKVLELMRLDLEFNKDITGRHIYEAESRVCNDLLSRFSQLREYSMS